MKNCSLKLASEFLFKESHGETFYFHLHDFRCKHPKKYIMYVVKKYILLTTMHNICKVCSNPRHHKKSTLSNDKYLYSDNSNKKNHLGIHISVNYFKK